MNSQNRTLTDELGLEYRASISPECPGCVEIWNLKTHAQIDSLPVYQIKYDPRMERDVQWVFITRLELRGQDLWVFNERGDSYVVNLTTKRVARVKKE